MKTILALLLTACLSAAAGCAGLTGLVTGAITGPRDCTEETMRQNSFAYHYNPMLYGVGAVLLTPVGLVTGPVCGFVKGVSLDVEATMDMVDYSEVFCTHNEASIWRPFTWEWPSRPGEKW
jgi:hypothetical protein